MNDLSQPRRTARATARRPAPVPHRRRHHFALAAGLPVDELRLLDCLTSCSVIAAATGFAPDEEPPCRYEPELADIDDTGGGGNDGSSFADSLTSAAVSAVSDFVADFVAEGAAAAWRSRPSRLRGARCVTCAGAAGCAGCAAGGVESCASTVTTLTFGGGALGFDTGCAFSLTTGTAGTDAGAALTRAGAAGAGAGAGEAAGQPPVSAPYRHGRPSRQPVPAAQWCPAPRDRCSRAPRQPARPNRRCRRLRSHGGPRAGASRMLCRPRLPGALRQSSRSCGYSSCLFTDHFDANKPSYAAIGR